MKASFAAVLAAVAVSGPALGADWVRFYEDPQKRRYLDVNSIVTDGPLRQAWLRTEFTKPYKDPHIGEYRSSNRLLVFDCRRRTHALKVLVAYKTLDEREEAIAYQTFPMERWEHTLPDTILDLTQMILCGELK